MLGFRFRVSGGVLVCVRCSFPVFNHIIQKELSLCIVRQTWPRVPQWCLSQARGKTKVARERNEVAIQEELYVCRHGNRADTPVRSHACLCTPPC